METEGKNIKTKLSDNPPQPFRGCAVHIKEDGKYGVEFVGGVTMLEVYGALTLVLEKMKKDLSM